MNKINISSLAGTALYPQINTLLEWISASHNSCRAESPLEIFSHDNEKNFGIKSNELIQKNDFVFSVSTTKCITGLDLVFNL